MRLQQVLDEAIQLLQHPEFKTYGALQKARYQHNKSEEDLFLRRDMYKGSIGNKEAAKKGAKTRKKWYENPENKKKYLEAIKKRNAKYGYKNKKSKAIDNL